MTVVTLIKRVSKLALSAGPFGALVMATLMQTIQHGLGVESMSKDEMATMFEVPLPKE